MKRSGASIPHEIKQDHFIATVGQFVGAAVAAVVLTVVAVSLTEGVERRRAGEAGA